MISEAEPAIRIAPEADVCSPPSCTCAIRTLAKRLSLVDFVLQIECLDGCAPGRPRAAPRCRAPHAGFRRAAAPACSPMRWRQCVRPEHSCGKRCRKNASPVEYWKYGFSAQRAHTASSDTPVHVLQPHHEPAFGAPPSGVAEQVGEFAVDPVPVDLLGEPYQFVARVDDLIEPSPQKVARAVVF